MLIKTLPVGQLETNCYIVINEKTLDCVVIDPGDESNYILDYIESNNLKCKAIFITHGHWDHIGAVDAVAEETKAVIFINERDNPVNNANGERKFNNAQSYDDGDTVEIAGMSFEIIATPGHTRGGVSIKVEDAIFVGDTLFRGSCGRTDLEGGDMETLLQSLRKLCSIDGEYEVYPGHMDSTSLIREKSLNFYCRKAMQS